MNKEEMMREEILKEEFGAAAESQAADREKEEPNETVGAESKTAEAENAETDKSEEAGQSEGGAKETSESKQNTEENSKQDNTQEVQDEALEIKYMRLMADFQNFRRRTEKEKSDIYQFANEGIVKELLDVVDNFERAFSTETEDKKYEEGMKMIFNQLMACLERAGVVEIDCLGKEFDPNYHNAVMTEDSTEYDSGMVTKVLQKGYLLHDRVVRPAMVMTAN